MKNLLNRKISAILLILFVIAICFSAFGYRNYKNKELLLSEINNFSNEFDRVIDRGEKLSILTNLMSNEQKYSDKYAKENYENALSNFRNWFSEDYNQTISKNTINDIDSVQDMDAINKSKINLNNAMNDIKSENALNFDDIKLYEKKINSLLNSYDLRINTIAEAEKKAEAERLEREERERNARIESERLAKEREALEANKAKQSSNTANNTNSNGNKSNSSKNATNKNNANTNKTASSGNNTGNNSGNNNNNNKNAGNNTPSSKPKNGVDISKLEHCWDVDLNTGKKIPGTDVWIDKSNGNVYDANGNFLYNGLW